MTTHRFQPYACPYCGEVNDAATTISLDDDAPPRAGDVTVCFKCASIAVFVVTPTSLSLRKPDPQELHDLRHDPQIAEFRAHLLRFVREQGLELKQV
jgi:hypothetical protein